MKRALAVAFALACAVAQAADEKPADFAHAATIELAVGSSHYRVAAGEALYRASRQRGLADVRVTNGAGEFVPVAIVQSGAAAAEREQVAAKLFPLHGDAAKGLDGVQMRIERSSAGTIVHVQTEGRLLADTRRLLGYLVELPALARPLESLALAWDAADGFAGGIAVEASDDLRRWTTVVAQAPLVRLTHAGETLEQNRVELPGVRAKYLRLSFRGVPAGFALRSATVALQPATPEPRRAEISVTGRADAEKRHEYLFDTGGPLPVDRLRFTLPQANTVAPLQVFSRDRADASWRPVASTVAWRLARDGGEVSSPAIAVAPNADRYWMVRVDARSGGLGSGDPGLAMQWIPHEIVFAARGAAPFTLLAGSRTVAPGALPIATVLPGHREGAPPAATEARLGALAANPVAAAAQPADSLKAAVATPEGRKTLLWVVLVAGVLFVLWMATRLLREMNGRQGPGSR